MDYILVPKLWTSTKKGLVHAKLKLSYNENVRFRIFFSSKSLLPARTLNSLTLGTSFWHQILTHTPSQKVCDLSVLIARQTSSQ